MPLLFALGVINIEGVVKTKRECEVHIGVAALGGNTRRVVGQEARQPFSLAVLELSKNRLDVRSFVAPGFSGKVPVKYQPESINGPLGLLRRLDGSADLLDKMVED